MTDHPSCPWRKRNATAREAVAAYELREPHGRLCCLLNVPYGSAPLAATEGVLCRVQVHELPDRNNSIILHFVLAASFSTVRTLHDNRGCRNPAVGQRSHLHILSSFFTLHLTETKAALPENLSSGALNSPLYLSLPSATQNTFHTLRFSLSRSTEIYNLVVSGGPSACSGCPDSPGCRARTRR